MRGTVSQMALGARRLDVVCMAYFGAAERLAMDAQRPQNRRGAGRMAADGLRCNLGSVLDLSRSGMRVRRRPWHKRILADHPIRVELEYNRVRIVIIGELRWTRPISKVADEVGIEFIMVDDDVKQDLCKMAAACCRERMNTSICDPWNQPHPRNR